MRMVSKSEDSHGVTLTRSNASQNGKNANTDEKLLWIKKH